MRPDERRSSYWRRHTDGTGQWFKDPPPGADLAALRSGLGREAGSVPALWSFYTTLSEDGRLSRGLQAEHVALGLFAVHQQSKRDPVHRTGTGLGRALLKLRRSGKFSEEAVDRRFAAAATATSFAEITVHLRGLINQLRSLEMSGLDYDRLYRDLTDWDDPGRRAQVRRRWGGQYFTAANETATIQESP